MERFLSTKALLRESKLEGFTLSYYMASAQGPLQGGRWGHAPPPQISNLGTSNVFGFPIFRENSVMYTINVQCFSLKKTVECMHSSVHCTMLFSTGYCSIHVYSQIHLHDLLVDHYTTIDKVQNSICEVISSNTQVYAIINVLQQLYI